MEYNQNEIKVYSNKCLEIVEDAYLNTLLSKRAELVSLIDLFLEGGNHREIELRSIKIGIEESFKPKIKEVKRVLSNTKKRLNYNLNKVV